MTSDFWIPNTQNNAPDWDTPLDLCSLHALPMKEPCQEGHTPCRFIRDDDTANEVSMFANHVYHQLSVLIGSRHFPKFANNCCWRGELAIWYPGHLQCRQAGSDLDKLTSCNSL